MRADRLLSLLMLLQSNGRMTARQLSTELDVSERTIYRDIEALCMAGVPVYTEHGPGGGVELVERYRTDLTGLTSAQAQAIFMLSIPTPLARLGLAQELKGALLKLSAGMPESQRRQEDWIRQRIYLDSSWWNQADEPAPYLPILQQAVWNDRRVKLSYRSPFGGAIERTVEPYGLVAKASVWYLVYAHRDTWRELRISLLLSAEILGETFERRAGFDLARYWVEYCTAVESNRPAYAVKIRVSPGLVPELGRLFGRQVETAVQSAHGQAALEITLQFNSIYDARDRLLALGGAVEVLEPAPLRLTLADFARQVVNLYKE